MTIFLSTLLARLDPGGGGSTGTTFPSSGAPWGGCVVDGVATLKCLPILFQNIVNAAILFAGVIALIMVIMSGIKFITSKGDQKQVEVAKKTLTYSIAGLIVILLSFAIINLIAYTTRSNISPFIVFPQ